MFKSVSDIFKAMKNLGPLKEQMAEIQARIARLRISGEAGAGMVRITVSGEGKVVDCQIDPHLLSPTEFALLGELFIAATNDALDKAREAAAYEMRSLATLPQMSGLDEILKKTE